MARSAAPAPVCYRPAMPGSIPSHARVVVIGGGIVGCSVAYHLTKLGWRDVVLLERRELSCGTTWHAAGLVGQLRSSHNLTRLARYGAVLYERLEAETGQATGFRRSGSISVARTAERLIELKRGASMARCFGVDIEVISPSEAGRLLAADAHGRPRRRGVDSRRWAHESHRHDAGDGPGRAPGRRHHHRQRDGDRHPTRARRGDRRQHGPGRHRVRGRRQLRGDVGRVRSVRWPASTCRCTPPSTSTSSPSPCGVARDLPVLRDTDGYIYVREEVGGLLMGGFEPVAKPWGMDGIPEDFKFSLLPEDWDHFRLLMEQACIRIPTLETAPVRRHVNGPESFTPDNRYMLGEAPELRNFFVAAGFNSVGIASAAGAGQALAEWIVGGEPSIDLWDVDIRRFMPFQGNARYLRERTREVVGSSTRCTGRSASPRPRATCAAPCCTTAWRRAARSSASSPAGSAPTGSRPTASSRATSTPTGARTGFPAPPPSTARCARASASSTRRRWPSSCFQGPDAVTTLQRLCANDVDVPPGRIVYTQMLNRRGGIECDLTVTRLADDTYMIVTIAAAATHDADWIRRGIGDSRVTLTDVTSSLTVLGVMGPRSRDLLSRLTGADLSNATFPFATTREIELGSALVRATRITYVGELGWELYIPTEFAPTVYEDVVAAGTELGLRHAGYHAMDSLRMEKGYRSWGHDIGSDDTPLEAGLGFAVAFKKADFVGRDALLRQRDKPLARRLVMFTLDHPDPLLLGDEPIYRDGALVGRITSGAYGHTLGRSVGMGYVAHADGVDAASCGRAAGSWSSRWSGSRPPRRSSRRTIPPPRGCASDMGRPFPLRITAMDASARDAEGRDRGADQQSTNNDPWPRSAAAG